MRSERRKRRGAHPTASASAFPLARAAAIAAAMALFGAGCAPAGGVRPFAAQPPVWVDPDRQPFAPPPAERETTSGATSLDRAFLRPLPWLLTFPVPSEALNVNALDEVPDSSWFTNRIGTGGMTPAQVAAGPCAGEPPLDPAGPWRIVGAKTEGAGLGFRIEDPLGRTWQLKLERSYQPERGTAAEVVGSRVYHAAGYHAPCNVAVAFTGDALAVDAESPLDRATLDRLLAQAPRDREGRHRAAASLFLEGRPLGSWSYEGQRDGDWNDVFPHEHRRELRGNVVLAAWLGHWDAVDHNTLAMWREASEGGGWVEHHMIDFADTLGDMAGGLVTAARRGTVHYDVPTGVEDALLLGTVERRWDVLARRHPDPVWGYFGAPFDAERWEPAKQVPAYELRTERDAAWMGRILARFRPEHVAAIVAEARLPRPELADQLTRILLFRRAALLERWLARLSPLAAPTVTADEASARLCLEDLAVVGGLVPLDARRVTAQAWSTAPGAPIAAGTPFRETPAARPRTAAPDQVCVDLAPVAGASAGRPAYRIVDVTVTGGFGAGAPARVHLYDHGPDGLLVVGLERPKGEPEAPRRLSAAPPAVVPCPHGAHCALDSPRDSR